MLQSFDFLSARKVIDLDHKIRFSNAHSGIRIFPGENLRSLTHCENYLFFAGSWFAILEPTRFRMDEKLFNRLQTAISSDVINVPVIPQKAVPNNFTLDVNF